MSNMSDILPSVAMQQGIIDASLNAQTLQNFITGTDIFPSTKSQLKLIHTGVYTMVYAWTMYLYLHGMHHVFQAPLLSDLYFSASLKSRSQRVVISAISILYALYISNWIIQWYLTDQSMIANGETRELVFMSIFLPSPSLFAFYTFLFYSGFAISDGLLASLFNLLNN